MNNFFSKALLALSAFQATVMLADPALAHNQSGSLGTQVRGAADLYAVTCSGGSDRLEVHVSDLLPKARPFVGVLVRKGNLTANSVDLTDGDGNYSPPVSVAGNDGDYSVLVYKTRAAPEIYDLEFHCKAGSTHTDTTIGFDQDQ